MVHHLAHIKFSMPSRQLVQSMTPMEQEDWINKVIEDWDVKTEIIKQYIATLKEDNELDYIFPLLLKQMGYRILLTPKQSKGQPQYGRDVVAVKNVDGVDTLSFFELKGFSAKDITDRTLSARDGIIESLNASKNTKYRDASILGLSKCPRKYVFVHNGYAETNALLTLNDYVEENF